MSENTIQPKTNQKLMVRTVILLFATAILFAVYQFYLKNKDDWTSITKSDTNGTIAMVEYGKTGNQVALLNPDGKIVKDLGYSDSSTDRDLTWSPDGNFVFFVSDREADEKSGTKVVHVYRWSPSQDRAEARTMGGRSRGNPTFPAEKSADESTSALMVSGGEVIELDPKSKKTSSVLPPRTAEIGRSNEEGTGAESQFSAAYGQLGTSFRVARWCKEKTWIAAVMRRDEGEILVCQNLVTKDGKLEPPRPIAAGQKIDIAVNPANGALVFSVRDFQWPGEAPPQFKKGGVVSRPFAHYIGMWTMEANSKPEIVLVAPGDKVSFGGIAPSPDGKELLAVAGEYHGDGIVVPKSLLLMPLKPNVGQELKPIAQGEIYEPSWHPMGNQILFSRKEPDGARSIIQIVKDGSGEKNLTLGKGNFGFPLYSPQSK